MKAKNKYIPQLKLMICKRNIHDQYFYLYTHNTHSVFISTSLMRFVFDISVRDEMCFTRKTFNNNTF